ncbi:AIR synthase related protein [Brevibacillus laterosporus]|uniref:AIR synthase related protein n=1 Tax=Brevibacillus laterosporus TaxID=1465 RepID=UPI00037E4A15|nr:AIR synthase related protein [Brevibacillus laterosporus]ATO48756.1 hypothetical protein BrL25_06320 [Brevibacillus laterosporus DSM 25]MBG9804450.1 hypothetical protein [Brevibacillus laterosporus]MED2005393.1 AIR synthase related protein [Brevibacillus laterosporus]MED4765231.1 AIR synthase related protein [Brevibacillus laterosporus]TPH14182.1 hypothetical protein EGH09_14720 [Brevibacillus laterosporus]
MRVPYLTNPLHHLQKVRDLTLFRINEAQSIVIACDSDGGIGTKPQDIVQIAPDMLGRFAVRVPLFELIACGASPFMICDTLSVEFEGYGEEILRGIKEYAKEAGVTEDIQFTGSTEENIPTMQTGVGITVLGLVQQSQFSPGTAQSREAIMCAGLPKSGPKHEVRLDDPEMLSLADLIHLRAHPGVHDLLPVGSKGIAYEMDQLAKSASLSYRLTTPPALDLEESGGPSTCVVFSASADLLEEFRNQLRCPVHVLAILE